MSIQCLRHRCNLHFFVDGCVQAATIASNNPFADILQTSDGAAATTFDLFDATSPPADDQSGAGAELAAAASTNNPFLFGDAGDEPGDDVTAVTQDDPWSNAGKQTQWRIQDFINPRNHMRTVYIAFTSFQGRTRGGGGLAPMAAR